MAAWCKTLPFPTVFSRLPLPFKILLWFFLNLALLLGGFFLIFSAEYRFNLDWIFSSHAQQRVEAMRDLIVDDLDTHDPDEWDDVIERFAGAYHVHLGLFDDHGHRLLGSVDTLPAEVRIHLRPTAPAAHAFIHTDAPTRYWLLVNAHVDNPRAGSPLALYVVAESPSASMGGLVIDPAPWLRLGAAAVVCSVLFWLPLLRGITRGIGQVTHAAHEIAEGRLDARVASRRRDELGVLAEAINRMAARLDGLLRGQKRFLSDVAHELCAPLAKLQMTLGIMEQRAADERQQAYARTAMEKAEQMARLVDELLVFSRASLEAPTARPQPVDVLAAAREAVAREAADGTGIRLEIPAGLCVLADPAGLTRALANLLRNALRYGGSRETGAISVHATPDSRDATATITVADHGPGVPETELPKIFDAFYRVDTARTRETGGVGLGLSIVKSSVEAAGGTVSARNRPSGGLEVSLRLPMVV